MASRSPARQYVANRGKSRMARKQLFAAAMVSGNTKNENIGDRLGLIEWKANPRQLASDKWQADRRKRLTEAIINSACRNTETDESYCRKKSINRKVTGNLYDREISRLGKIQQKKEVIIREEKLKRNRSKMNLESRRLTRSTTTQNLIKVKLLRFQEEDLAIKKSRSYKRLNRKETPTSSLHVKSYHHLIDTNPLFKSEYLTITSKALKDNIDNDIDIEDVRNMPRESSIDPFLADRKASRTPPRDIHDRNESSLEGNDKRLPRNKIPVRRQTQKMGKKSQEKIRLLQKKIDKKSTGELLNDLEMKMSKQQSTMDYECMDTAQFLDF